MKFKKSFLIFFRMCISSDYRFVRPLHVFDARYYAVLKGVQDTCDDEDLLWGYLKTKGSDLPVDDFLDRRWNNLAEPHPLFDSRFYLYNYFPTGLDENPFAHYLKKGWKKGLHPGPFFDQEFYCRKSGWHEDDGDPLTHYAHFGAPKGRCPSRYFDVDWYLDKNPVLKGATTEIARLYKLYGAPDGKSPVPVFDSAYYLSQAGVGEEAAQDPASHYITTAKLGSHRPAAWFDPDYYLLKCRADISRESALAHYLTEGVFEQIYTDARVEQLPEKPLISIVVPVYNPDIRFLNSCIRSVLYQAYPHWELCLADDCSEDQTVRVVLEEWVKKDSRIKLILLDKNRGISGATNAAAAMATGKFLSFLDNDDELSADCLYYVAEAICHHGADLLYSDEDLIGDDGRRLSVFRKPAFNSELLLSHNYITHFVTVAKELFELVGGLDSQYDGAQDFDLLLKLSEQTKSVHHIPKVLYHWRALSTSTSINHNEKGYAHEAGKRALEAGIRRRNYAAVVEDGDVTYCYRLKYSIPQIIKVAVLIWSDSFVPGDIARLVREISKSSYPNATYRFVSDNPDIGDWIKSSMNDDSGLRVDHHSAAPGTSRAQALHQAVLLSESDVIALLDSAVLAVESDWLEELLGPFCLDDVGIVCGRVFHEGGDGRSYTLPDLGEESGDYYQAFLHSGSRHLNGLHCLQQISFGGWEVTMIDRELYLEVGGFDWNSFPVRMSMADLSLKMAGMGKRIVYTPYARIHTAGRLQDQQQKVAGGLLQDKEKSRFSEKWGHYLRQLDQFYNCEVLWDNGIDGDRFKSWFSGAGTIRSMDH